MGTEKKEDQHDTVVQLLPPHISYAAIVDSNDNEHEISDLMVRRACKEMDKEQQFPFAPKLSAGSTP